MSRTPGVAFAIAIALGLSLLGARVHPFGDAGLHQTTDAPPIRDHNSIPPNVRALLIAKCADCHSSQTRAPFYSYFAPISWLLERDIVEARKRMNLSNWDTATPDQQDLLKAKILQEVRSGEMPVLQYRIVHWNASTTPADLQTFTNWAHASTSSPAMAATLPGDPARGQAVFEKRCTGCHALDNNREGPRLQGVYGRPSAAIPNFPYSVALRNAHLTWNDQTLDQWLTDPDALILATNMDFRVPKPQERQDLIAFLKQSAAAPR